MVSVSRVRSGPGSSEVGWRGRGRRGARPPAAALWADAWPGWPREHVAAARAGRPARKWRPPRNWSCPRARANRAAEKTFCSGRPWTAAATPASQALAAPAPLAGHRNRLNASLEAAPRVAAFQRVTRTSPLGTIARLRTATRPGGARHRRRRAAAEARPSARRRRGPANPSLEHSPRNACALATARRARRAPAARMVR